MASPLSTVVYVAYHDKEVTVILLLMYLVTALIGTVALILNAIVLDTLVKSKSLDCTDLLICSLAVTDMLTGVLILHTVSYGLVNFQSRTECLVRLGVIFIFVACSMYHLLLLTIDRFVKIVFPFRYQSIISRRSVVIMSSAAWIFSINIGLLPVYGWNNEPDPSGPPCAMLHVLTKEYIQYSIFFIYAPFVAMFVMYVKIFLLARKHSRAIMALNFKSKTAGIRVALKGTKTVLILIGAYFVSFTPMAIVGLMYTLGGFKNMTAADVGDYVVYTSVLTFANSIVNPVIYAFKVPPVRKRFLKLFRRTKTSNTEWTVTETSVANRATISHLQSGMQ